MREQCQLIKGSEDVMRGLLLSYSQNAKKQCREALPEAKTIRNLLKNTTKSLQINAGVLYRDTHTRDRKN